MLHGNCGKQHKHTINTDIESKIIEIRKNPDLEEYNFIHFQKILEEAFNIKISYATLYQLLRKNGFKNPIKHKKYCLHGFIDDATHKFTSLYMCENECIH